MQKLIKANLNLLYISFISIVLFGCAETSVYLGGAGAFSDYEDKSYFGSSHNTFNDVFLSPGEVGLAQNTMRDSAAIQRATMKPYQVAGVWYYPQLVKMGDKSEGLASWYGPDFHSKKTSNGETYNMYAHTAAHKTFPMNTVVKVYNLENGRTTIVRINDRGPFVEGRIIDLSNVAAHDIEMVGKGVAKVRLEVIGFGGVIDKDMEDALVATNAQPNENPMPSTSKDQAKPLDDEGDEFINNNTENMEIVDSGIAQASQGANVNVEIPLGVSPAVVEGGLFSIQIGAFKNKSGATSTAQKHDNIESYKTKIKEYDENGGKLYRVFISGFKSESEAADFLKNHSEIKSKIIIRDE